MRQHPKKASQASTKKSGRAKVQRSKRPKPPAALLSQLQHDGGGFLTLLLNRVGWKDLNGLQHRKHAAGRPAHALSRADLLTAILFHYTVTWAGTLGEHLFWLLGIKMTESNLSERRQALPFTVFQE